MDTKAEFYILEAEEKILGTYREYPDLFAGKEHLVFEELFVRAITRAMYKMIKSFHESNIIPDTTLLFDKAKSLGFSTQEAAFVVGPTVDFSCVHNPKQYIDILFNNYVARCIMPTMYSCYTQLTNYTGDAIDVMNKMKDVITQVDLILNNASTDKSVKDIFDETLKRIMDLKNNVIENTGYSFGLTQVDAKTGGLMKGVNVIGALPGAGKTSLVVNIIKTNAIDSIVPTLFFSIEMPAVEIMTNIIANDTSINSRALRQGDVDDGAIMSINSMSSKIKNNLSIDDNGNVTWQYVEAKVRAFKKKNKVTPDKTSIVIIDYLQLMSNSADEIKGTTEEQRIAKICKELTRIAKSENCAIVLLSQLSRDGGKRENPRPKMSDLKGSGAIEACAILILLLFRPEYHGILTDEKGNDLTGLCEINPVKGRYIKPEPVYVRFEGKYSKFSDYTESPF